MVPRSGSVPNLKGAGFELSQCLSLVEHEPVQQQQVRSWLAGMGVSVSINQTQQNIISSLQAADPTAKVNGLLAILNQSKNQTIDPATQNTYMNAVQQIIQTLNPKDPAQLLLIQQLLRGIQNNPSIVNEDQRNYVVSNLIPTYIPQPQVTQTTYQKPALTQTTISNGTQTQTQTTVRPSSQKNSQKGGKKKQSHQTK